MQLYATILLLAKRIRYKKLIKNRIPPIKTIQLLNWETTSNEVMKDNLAFKK